MAVVLGDKSLGQTCAILLKANMFVVIMMKQRQLSA